MLNSFKTLTNSYAVAILYCAVERGIDLVTGNVLEDQWGNFVERLQAVLQGVGVAPYWFAWARAGSKRASTSGTCNTTTANQLHSCTDFFFNRDALQRVLLGSGTYEQVFLLTRKIVGPRVMTNRVLRGPPVGFHIVVGVAIHLEHNTPIERQCEGKQNTDINVSLSQSLLRHENSQ